MFLLFENHMYALYMHIMATLFTVSACISWQRTMKNTLYLSVQLQNAISFMKFQKKVGIINCKISAHMK